MKYLILLAFLVLATCQSCTVARSAKGDFIATSARVGVLRGGNSQHSGGITGIPFGSVSSLSDAIETDAAQPGMIRVGDIVMTGAISHGDPLATIGETTARVMRNAGAVKVGRTLINATSNTVETLSE